MDCLTYLHRQMRLEGKELVDDCLMRQVEDVPGEDMPLLLLAQLADGGVITYYDEAISRDLQQELAAARFKVPFPDVDPLLHVLQRRSFSFEIGDYKTYAFPSPPSRDTDVLCFSTNDPKVKAFGFDGFSEPVYAITSDDKLVSACVSARENEACGEAWVYTDPSYRHRGFAQKTVCTWASHLIEDGKIPFYSHKMENVASGSLAKKWACNFYSKKSQLRVYE